MEYITVLKSGFRRHKAGMLSVFVLLCVIFVSLVTVLSVWINARNYVTEQMNRLGFGDFTVWVSKGLDTTELQENISQMNGVEKVNFQPLIYSNYRIADKDSDSEGQLIPYDPKSYSYKIYTDDLAGYQENQIDISPGEVYISPSLSSMFQIKPGDEILFPIARQGVEQSFIVKGYFEDPFMGSSMIGMKSFLICEQDSDKIRQGIQEFEINALAREGFMVHISLMEGSFENVSEFNRSLNEWTNIAEYTEFAHSHEAILGFMLLLHNVFCGILLAFSAVLIVVCIVVLGHSLDSSVEQEYENMGILKSIGFTGRKLRNILMIQYLSAVVAGLILGGFLSVFLTAYLNTMTITITGLLMPADIQVEYSLLFFLCIVVLLAAFIHIKTTRINRISPIAVFHVVPGSRLFHKTAVPRIYQKGMGFTLALRQLLSGKKRYISACIVAALLVFFASIVGRMDDWLGADGNGMMNAFHPAELDIGVQPMSDITLNEIENTILAYSEIDDQYLLAMPGVSVNGADYTANVISEPERFHILQGKTCTQENEVVLTEIAAKDLNVKIGDTVTAAFGTKSREYVVSGIYQCANDMGVNIGMSRDAFAQIGMEDPSMWCSHYLLKDTQFKTDILQALEDIYGRSIHVHENTWPGLYSMIDVMHGLMIFMYGSSAVFILVVTMLTGSKLLSLEQKEMGIYKVLGFTDFKLQAAFASRFFCIALFGAICGVLLSNVFADRIISSFFRMFGISNFASNPSVVKIWLPAVVVVGLYVGFTYLRAGKIKKINLITLIRK